MVCPLCGSPSFVSERTQQPTCDCWKALIAPSTRQARQVVIATLYIARKERERFETKQAQRSAAEQTVRGQFGSQKARRLA